MKIEGKVWSPKGKVWVDNADYIYPSRSLPKRNKKVKLSGIYAIFCDELRIVYIGQSINLHSRWSQHKHILNKGTSEIKELQDAWNSHKEKFFFKILELTNEGMKEKERDYAQKYVDSGYSLLNSYFHVNPRNLLIDSEHIPVITKLLRLVTKGRLDIKELDRYLDTL